MRSLLPPQGSRSRLEHHSEPSGSASFSWLQQNRLQSLSRAWNITISSFITRFPAHFAQSNVFSSLTRTFFPHASHQQSHQQHPTPYMSIPCSRDGPGELSYSFQRDGTSSAPLAKGKCLLPDLILIFQRIMKLSCPHCDLGYGIIGVSY